MASNECAVLQQLFSYHPELVAQAPKQNPEGPIKISEELYCKRNDARVIILRMTLVRQC